MIAGNLIKHKKTTSTALIIAIILDRDARDPEYDRDWVRVWFTGDNRLSTVPLELIKENWEVINGEI